MMKKNNFQSYWEDIRKTFILYSLIPILSLLIIGYPLTYKNFLDAIQEKNEQNALNIVENLEMGLQEQLNTVKNIQSTQIIRQFLKDAENDEIKNQAYVQFYELLNTCSITAWWYVLDPDENIVLSNTKELPQYLADGCFLLSGPGKRMKSDGKHPVIEQYGSIQNGTNSMCVGQVIEEAGNILGYVIADIPGRVLLNLTLNNHSVISAITDQYGYLFSGNVAEEFLPNGKIHSLIRKCSGKVTVGESKQYVFSKNILDGKVIIYSLTDIGYLDAMFIRTGILIFIAAVFLSTLLYGTSHWFAKRKSKILDDMVFAVRRVGEGDMDVSLKVETGDEFQIFAEEYNRMLIEVKRLLELNKEIGRQTAISELKQLESQFNPHFLFNTLTAIRYMTAVNKSKAQEMIELLCEILRYSIKTAGSQSTLSEDWKYTQQYLTIMKYRFGDALHWEIDIDDQAMECMVPKLMLQPIIENAVTYGFMGTDELHIKISISLKGEMFTAEIVNNGEIIDASRLEEIQERLNGKKKGHSIGLYNIHRRIQLLYGESYGLTVTSTVEDGTKVHIEFFMEKGAGDDTGSCSGR